MAVCKRNNLAVTKIVGAFIFELLQELELIASARHSIFTHMHRIMTSHY